MIPKFKMAILIGVLALFFVGAGGVYLTMMTVRYISELGITANISKFSDTIESKAKVLPNLKSSQCLIVVKGLLNADKLLGIPLNQNFDSLKEACLVSREPGPIPREENQVI